MWDQDWDKRRHVRRPLSLCAWLEFGHTTGRHGMRTHDVSLEGARFASARPIKSGAKALLHMQLGSRARAIECKARVCWTRVMEDGLCHFGVRFVDLEHEEELDLTQFLDSSLPPLTLSAV